MEAVKERKIKLPAVNRKLLFILPMIMLLISASYVVYLVSGPGLSLDIDLKGGSQITADSSVKPDAVAMESALKSFDANVRSGRGVTGWNVVIEVPSNVNTDDVINQLTVSGWDLGSYSVQIIEPTLSASFFKQAQIALIIAFICMSITVFIIFRVPLPSFYVVLVAAADITTALAVSQFLGIKLSLATFSALLMLVGYSVDADVLLTSRVLKTVGGDTDAKIRGALKTGLTMTGSAIVALIALYMLSSSAVITQIASVLLIGLLADIPYTWIINAGLLRWYVEKKNKKAVA